MKIKEEAIKAFIWTVISYFLSSKFNFAEFFSFIPNDRKIEVNLLFYTAIMSIVIDLVFIFFSNIKNDIEIIVYKKNGEKNLNINPNIIFSNTNVAEVFLNITVTGKIKKNSELKMIISLPEWIEPQCNVQRRENGIYEYNLIDILGIPNSTQRVSYTQVEKFPMIANINSKTEMREADVKISFEIEKKYNLFKCLLYNFKSNFFIVKIGGNSKSDN